MASWIEVVRDAVTMQEVLERYVGSPNRAGKYLCPFHRDKNPSLSINPRTDKFKCFSCGEAGDTIDFVQNLFHVQQREALEILSRDFGLGLETMREEPDAARQAKLRREAEKRQQEELKARTNAQLEVLWLYWRIMQDGYYRTAPKSESELPHFIKDTWRVRQCEWFFYQSAWLMWLLNCLEETAYHYDLSDCRFNFDLFKLGEMPYLFTDDGKSEDFDRRKKVALRKLEKGEFEPICRASNLHISTSA